MITVLSTPQPCAANRLFVQLPLLFDPVEVELFTQCCHASLSVVADRCEPCVDVILVPVHVRVVLRHVWCGHPPAGLPSACTGASSDGTTGVVWTLCSTVLSLDPFLRACGQRGVQCRVPVAGTSSTSMSKNCGACRLVLLFCPFCCCEVHLVYPPPRPWPSVCPRVVVVLLSTRASCHGVRLLLVASSVVVLLLPCSPLCCSRSAFDIHHVDR